jgi:hypothetical protein
MQNRLQRAIQNVWGAASQLICVGFFAKGGTPDHLVLGQGIGRTELPSHVAIGKLREASGLFEC